MWLEHFFLLLIVDVEKDNISGYSSGFHFVSNKNSSFESRRHLEFLEATRFVKKSDD